MTDIKLGWFEKPQENIPRTAYQSANKIKKFVTSPSLYHAVYCGGYEEPSTPAKEFGKVVHKALLEPWVFMEKYAVIPEFSGTGMRAAKAEWLEKHEGRIILKQDEVDQITGMISSLQKHQYASKLIRGGRRELCGYFEDETIGGNVLIKPDLINEDTGLMISFKTAADATEEAFMKQVGEFAYDWSEALHLHGANKISGGKFRQSIWIAIEKTPPYDIGIYALTPHMFEEAMGQIRLVVQAIQKCEASGVWPSYNFNKIVDASLPIYIRYARERMELKLEEFLT